MKVMAIRLAQVRWLAGVYKEKNGRDLCLLRNSLKLEVHYLSIVVKRHFKMEPRFLLESF